MASAATHHFGMPFTVVLYFYGAQPKGEWLEERTEAGSLTYQEVSEMAVLEQRKSWTWL